MFRRKSVDLIKGQRPEPDRYAAQGIFDKSRTVERVCLIAEDDVGVFGVDVQQDGRDIRELLTQPADKLFGVGQLWTGADEADHDLTAVDAAPQENVADKSFSTLLIVGLNVVVGEKCTERVANVVQDAGLKLAVRAGNDTVGAACIESNAGLAVFAAADRELNFVAVAVNFRRGECRQDGNIQTTDTAESIGYIFLLGGKLCLIAQMAQAASAARPGGRTVSINAVGRSSQKLVQNTKSVPFAVLDDLHTGNIAGSSTGNKNGLAVIGMCDAAAIVGETLDF